MKPKNRKYCPYCQKAKLLFETEAKAENFMKYNADEIYNETGKKPVRAYYCMACGGWHVTSLENSYYSVSRVEHNMIEWTKQSCVKQEAKKREMLVNDLVNAFRLKLKSLEKLIKCHEITKEECLQRLQALENNFEVFKAHITGHAKFLDQMTIRMESLSRECTPVRCYVNN